MTDGNDPARQGGRTAEEAYDVVARQLVAEAAPVRRLPALHTQVSLCVFASVGVLGLFTVLGPRPDLTVRLASWSFVLEILAFAATGIPLMTLALAGAMPDRTPGPAVWSVVAGAGLFTAIAALAHTFDAGTPMSTFLRHGVPCTLGTLGLAVTPAAVILLSLWRGAPLAPGRSGALAGAAALLLAYLAMRLHCPIDDGLHLLVWHAAPIVPIVAATSGIAILCLRAWRA